MVAAVLILLMLIHQLLERTAAAWGPDIPVRKVMPKASISTHVSQQRTDTLLGRGIAGIQNVAYTERSYNVLLSVGSIPFEIALDTGSSDFWVISEACETSQCRGTPAFPLSKYTSPSFSSINDNQTAFIAPFADGTAVSGFVARETVSIGSVQAVEQAFGLVTSSNLTLGMSTSGVLGLGFPRLSRIACSTPNAPPFLSTLVETGQLAYPMFALSLTRDFSGTLSMGAIDASVVSNASEISWHHVTPFAPLSGDNATSTPLYLNWALPLDNLTVNGTSITLHPTYSSITGPSPLSLLDVGNNGIYGPYEDVAAIFAAMGTIRQVTEGVWVLPCNSATAMTFSFSGTNVTLQPSDYLIGPTQGDPSLCLSWPVALPPNADGLDWHLGTPFLRTVYSVYSYGIAGHEPPMIGLYPLIKSTSLTDTPSLLSSAFSSLSATVSTTAPIILLPTPSYSIPAYLFNTTTPFPTAGQITPAQSDLGASSYSPLFRQKVILSNETALPKLDPPSTIVTLIITDASGIYTTTSTVSSIPTAGLGKPPGARNRAQRSQMWNRTEWVGVWLMASVVGWAWVLSQAV